MTEAERARHAAQVVEELRAHGRRPYLIGDPVVAALGYVRAAQELAAQAEGLDLCHVLLPGSMGPTEAGFIFGSAVIGAPWTVHLVSVEYPEDELRRRVEALVQKLQARTGLVPPKDPMAGIRIDMAELGAAMVQPRRHRAMRPLFSRRMRRSFSNRLMSPRPSPPSCGR